ncbi:glycogen synthase GlgA [Burkholderia thailandensis]|nr:glycogen synthase GlgA [Burkholderia thailandensis]MCS3400719.1 glycogen synthase GlgA [Burkholderia thailandensis]MCS6478459.1 glycogen synthase GlgA [Burkholderia thailandensis]MCS6501864.1 glycogen synthase GlgA [Burkholderia thailandensis]MCS6508382.1 glycogen synthase GlgA [Burkholderia thailandensis]MCS6520290.1 glycogen synthase GlgA [Burkholderia thailandensis]
MNDGVTGRARGASAGRGRAGPRVMFVASEAFPLAKTGGLADVCASLPKALRALGCDVRVLMPGYAQALDRVLRPRVVAELGEVLPGAAVRIIAGSMPDSGVPVWLLDCPSLYRRAGSLYCGPDDADWADNAYRFGLLCQVAARVALGAAGLRWRPDVVHAHDWHGGLVALLTRGAGDARPKTVFTIHNAAFQGNFALDDAARIGLPADALSVDGVEFYGQLSFLKAGARYADRLTTVSPTYAGEIQTAEFGCGLEGLYAARRDQLSGIMNGIDTELWNPATDRWLPQPYSIDDMGGKAGCKAALQQELGLCADARAPLVASVCRLTSQKMSDIVLERLPEQLAQHPRMQFALHGRGDRALEQGFDALAAQYPRRVAVRIGYDETLAHRIHAGADILLHGARFEPCGLTQLYAMRYGTIPIVRRVGGLADSVVDLDTLAPHSEDATGFVFDAPTGDAMSEALRRCVNLHDARPGVWSALCRLAMARDSSWSRSARAYLDLYAALTLRRRVEASDEARGAAAALARADAASGRRRRAPEQSERLRQERLARQVALASK